MKLFSAFAAAEMLERDRQTIVRALRNVPPDGEEGQQPRWKLATIVTALDRHSRPHNVANASGADPELIAIFRNFDEMCDAMTVLPTLAERRAAALKLAPEIAAVDRTSRQRARANGVDAELADLRADQLFRLYLRRFEKPCNWTDTECWENLDATADAR
jgi:hypothetical protein